MVMVLPSLSWSKYRRRPSSDKGYYSTSKGQTTPRKGHRREKSSFSQKRYSITVEPGFPSTSRLLSWIYKVYYTPKGPTVYSRTLWSISVKSVNSRSLGFPVRLSSTFNNIWSSREMDRGLCVIKHLLSSVRLYRSEFLLEHNKSIYR